MNVKTILSALFILLMSATAMAQTKTADFKGSWSSEGEVPEKGRLELEINQQGITVTGTASYKNYENNNQSGVCSISGKITGNKATFTIVLNSKIIAKGTLVKEGNKIKFISNTGSSFPKQAYAYKR
ncbi:MAG: hypothetical protein IPN14_11920 [Bacteroidetes bacterium]|nr:hypothetical protein [Bacteroidota bacterium]